MFEKVASKPFTVEIPASPQAELLAQGFASKYEAPAEPTRSSFPALAAKLHKTAPAKNTFFKLIIEFFIVN